MVLRVKSLIEGKTNKKYDTFEPLKVKTQVVAGTNYLVKIDIGNSEHLHVKIHKPLPHVNGLPEILEVNEGKTSHDEL